MLSVDMGLEFVDDGNVSHRDEQQEDMETSRDAPDQRIEGGKRE